MHDEDHAGEERVAADPLIFHDEESPPRTNLHRLKDAGASERVGGEHLTSRDEVQVQLVHGRGYVLVVRGVPIRQDA